MNLKLHKSISILIDTAINIGYNINIDDIQCNNKPLINYRPANIISNYNNYSVRSTDYMFSLCVSDINHIPMAYYHCPNCLDDFFCGIENDDTIKKIKTKIEHQIQIVGHSCCWYCFTANLREVQNENQKKECGKN